MTLDKVPCVAPAMKAIVWPGSFNGMDEKLKMTMMMMMIKMHVAHMSE